MISNENQTRTDSKCNKAQQQQQQNNSNKYIKMKDSMTISHSIITMIIISQLLLLLIFGSGPCRGAKLVHEGEALATSGEVDYVLEWIGRPEVTRSQGEKKQVSSVIYTGDESNTVTVTKDFSHSFSISKGVTLDLGDLLQVAKAKFSVDITHKSDIKTALNHHLSLTKRSKGIVMFREQLLTLAGRARKVYKNTWIGCKLTGITRIASNRDCKSGSEEVDIEVTGTQVDVSGSALGTFSVEYLGTDKYKHPDFYHIVNKTLNTEGAMVIDEKMTSPYSCAERADLFEKTIGLYDVVKMQCLLLNAKQNNGTSFDREGHELGDYNYIDNDNLDASQTYEKKERQRWVKERRCDVIHNFMARLDAGDSDYDYEQGGGAGESSSETNKVKYKQRYLCKSFEEFPAKVIMMRRSKSKEKEVSNNNNKQQVDETTITTDPDQRGHSVTRTNRASPVKLRTPKPTAAPSHPKFYQLNGRHYAPPDVAKGMEPGTKTIQNINSAYECGEQAMEAAMYLAVYKLRERVCRLEPVVWNHGRSMDTNGKQLGPFEIENMREVDRTNDQDKSKEWAQEDNTNCDIIRETSEASYACKAFETASNDASIVLIRYIDTYEIKRVNRLKKQEDYDRVLFSRSQHPKFYSIKGKDYPMQSFKTLARVNSSQHCGDLVLRNDKYLAVYNPKEHICSIKEVDNNDGQGFDRWNQRLGNYDLPKYTLHRTESNRELERWVDLTECDFIHAKEDGTKHCKSFQKAPDLVLMLRKVEM